MKRTFGAVTVLSLISTLVAVPAFSQAAAFSPPAGEAAANPPYWYFDRPAVPLSPFAGQPGSLISPDAGQPYGYDRQLAALSYAGQIYAHLAQPPAPVAYATRRYAEADYASQALEQGPRPCKPAIKCR
jgi:hypothetical protein